MKKMFEVLFFLLIPGISIFAQKNHLDEYFVTFDGDTVYTDIKVGSKLVFSDLTWQMKYYDSLNNVQKLSPKYAKEVCFYLGVKPYHFISVLNTERLPSPPTLSGIRFFAEVNVDGHLKLLTYYGYNMNIFYPAQEIKYLLLKPGEEMFLLDDNSFSKKKKKIRIKSYFEDCPALVEKIERGEIRFMNFRNLEEIANFYNTHCVEGDLQKTE
jgi:hypothetical protein